MILAINLLFFKNNFNIKFKEKKLEFQTLFKFISNLNIKHFNLICCLDNF